MNARFVKSLSLRPVQLLVNEHGLLQLNVRRRPLRLPVKPPADATWRQAAWARLEQLLDFLFEG